MENTPFERMRPSSQERPTKQRNTEGIAILIGVAEGCGDSSFSMVEVVLDLWRDSFSNEGAM